MLKTTTLEKFPDINIDTIYAAMMKVKEVGPFYHRLKCSPEAYIAIKDYFMNEEHEAMMRKYSLVEYRKRKKIEEPKEIPNYWGSLFGIDIVLDPEQKPGQWEFE